MSLPPGEPLRQSHGGCAEREFVRLPMDGQAARQLAAPAAPIREEDPMRDPRARMPYELVLAELSRSLKPASVVAGLLGAPERG